jgi:hypothetical protein
MLSHAISGDTLPPKGVTSRRQNRARLVTERAKVRLSLDVSTELNDLLEELAYKTHSSKSDVLRKAIALMELAVIAKEQGRTIGVAEKGGSHLIKEVVGL